MTKSHIPTINTPTRNDVHVGQLTNESKIRLKRGRLVGSNDVTPQKMRTQEKLDTLKEVIKMIDQFKIDKSIAPEKAQIMQKAPKEAHIKREAPEDVQIPENCEISLSYVHTGEKWDQNNIVINNIFSFKVASYIIRNDEDLELRNVEEC